MENCERPEPRRVVLDRPHEDVNRRIGFQEIAAGRGRLGPRERRRLQRRRQSGCRRDDAVLFVRNDEARQALAIREPLGHRFELCNFTPFDEWNRSLLESVR